MYVDNGKVLGDTNDGFVVSVRRKAKQRLYGRELNENLRVCAESESVGGILVDGKRVTWPQLCD